VRESSSLTRFATRDTHRLSYEAHGDPGGAAILALHDLLGDRAQLRPLAEALAIDQFRVILPDARGHGASAMISGGSYPARALAADALAVAAAEGLAPARIVAVGWSAATALAIALAAPERVVSLLLVAPYLPGLLGDGPVPDIARLGRNHLEALAAAASAAEKGQTDRALDLFLDERRGAAWRERLPKPRLGAIRRSAASLGALLAGILAEPIGRQALRDLTVPVTLLVSDDASPLERGSVEAVTAVLPRARIEPLASVAGVDADLAPAMARALAGSGG
jgi:pimeloyl-ACP methyl ester carboxylesterase